MGSCTRRHFMLTTCFLQMITTIERQVFDFLGYMWLPILLNFFHILVVIFGFYGTYHLRIKYVSTYLAWNLLWISWNIFLICFYLNVGILYKESDILNLGTGSVSWFEVNGYGCTPVYSTNFTTDELYRPLRPERVDDCLLPYELIEILHSALQCILAFISFFGAISIIYLLCDDDDRLKYANKAFQRQKFLYSIEFGGNSASGTLSSRADNFLDYGDDQLIRERIGSGYGGGNGDDNDDKLSPKPMTPRRVKRRSVMARGSNNSNANNSNSNTINSSGGNTYRQSHRINGSSCLSRSYHHNHNYQGDGASAGAGAGVNISAEPKAAKMPVILNPVAIAGICNTRTNSTRTSRRKYQQNSVTKILDQQQPHYNQQPNNYIKQTQKHQKLHQDNDYRYHQQQSLSTLALRQQPHHQQHQQLSTKLATFQKKEDAAASNLDTFKGPYMPNNINAVSSVKDIGVNEIGNIGHGGGDEFNSKEHHNHQYEGYHKNIPLDPIYHNTNALALMGQYEGRSSFQEQLPALQSSSSPMTSGNLTLNMLNGSSSSGGHYNPTYLHSTTSLNDGERIDELHNNRPPSVHSSYSNFHGSRPFSSSTYSSTRGGRTTENVFAGLLRANQSPSPTLVTTAAPSPPPPPPPPSASSFQSQQTVEDGNFLSHQLTLYHQHHNQHQHQHLPSSSSNRPSFSPEIMANTASLTKTADFAKRSVSRESIRSMTFLNNGPPAYNLNYHTPPDSETTM